MALNNTTERLNYIYGNNARKVDRFANYTQTTSPRKENPSYGEITPKKQKKQNVHVVELFDTKYTILVLLAVLAIFMGALVYANQAARMNRLASEIRELKAEKVQLQSKQVSIMSEIDKAINLDSVRNYAEKKLGMVVPTHGKTIYYNQDSSDYFRQYESVDK